MKRLLAAMLLLLSAGALAQPKPLTAPTGVATFPSTGNTLTITNTPGAIINWQPFQIGAGGTPRIEQPPSSPVLNRITVNPQVIQGVLQAGVPTPGATTLFNGSGVQVMPLPSGAVTATRAVQTPDGRIVFQSAPK